jgi:hypothetical protein
VRAETARAEIRATLKGHSTTPITRAGRERQRAAVVAAPLIGADRGAIPQDPAKIFGPGPARPWEGLGFCLPCYDDGRITLATDPDQGSTCDRHAADAAVAS